MKQLQDMDKMPFGNYAGTLMQDVPASYLHWLWIREGNPLKKRIATEPVADYIKRNLPALKHEYPDGIWE